MQEHERTFRPALAAIVLICFFMPFIKISCAGQPIVSITGFDLVVGKTIQPPAFLNQNNNAQTFADEYPPYPPGQIDPGNGADQPQFVDPEFTMDQSAGADPSNPFGQTGDSEVRVDTEPLAAAAMCLAVLALLSALGGSRRAMQISAVSSGLVAAVLLIFKVNAGGDMPTEFMGVIALEWGTAFWVALVTSAALAWFTIRLISQTGRQRQKPRLVIQTLSDKPPSETIRH